MTPEQASARARFIALAAADMLPPPPPAYLDHHYESTWEELCSILEDLHLAEGFWPSEHGVKHPHLQPPYYRRLVDPKDVPSRVRPETIPRRLKVARVASVWWEVCEGFTEPVTDPETGRPWPLSCPLRPCYRDHIVQLEILGFARSGDDWFTWHPLLGETLGGVVPGLFPDSMWHWPEEDPDVLDWPEGYGD